MIFTKDTSKGVFPGISVQLFDFETPVSKIATIACHSLPASWGAFHLPNDAGTRTMVMRLEDSPFCEPGEWDGKDGTDLMAEDAEEYRPLDGDVWIFHGSSEAMWELVKDNPDTFINCLVYHKLDQSKRFSDSVIELHAKGAY